MRTPERAAPSGAVQASDRARRRGSAPREKEAHPSRPEPARAAVKRQLSFVTLPACGPFGPSTISNSTVWPSSSVRNPLP